MTVEEKFKSKYRIPAYVWARNILLGLSGVGITVVAIMAIVKFS